MCVCVDDMYVYAYTYKHTHMCALCSLCVWCLHVLVICTCMYVYVCVWFMYIFTCMFMCVYDLCIYLHTYIQKNKFNAHECPKNKQVCIRNIQNNSQHMYYTRKHSPLHTRAYTSVCMYMCTCSTWTYEYVHMYTFVREAYMLWLKQTYTHICMHVCICICPWSLSRHTHMYIHT